MPPPKMNRHFRSRLVSPSRCLKVRYDTFDVLGSPVRGGGSASAAGPRTLRRLPERRTTGQTSLGSGDVRAEGAGAERRGRNEGEIPFFPAPRPPRETSPIHPLRDRPFGWQV